MFYLNLNNLEFMACHGVQDEEKTTPQKFIIDIKIETDTIIKAALTDKLEDCLDYVNVFELVRTIMMDEQYALLETLASQISNRIIQLDSSCISVETKVTKANPPIAGFTGMVSCDYLAFGSEGNEQN